MSTHTRLELKLRTLRTWMKPGIRCVDTLHWEEWEVFSTPWVEGVRILVKVHQPMTCPKDTKVYVLDALTLEMTK